MISQQDLDRALFRWKNRQAGGDAARTPVPGLVEIQADEPGEAYAEAEVTYEAEANPSEEIEGDTGSGALLLDEETVVPR